MRLILDKTEKAFVPTLEDIRKSLQNFFNNYPGTVEWDFFTIFDDDIIAIRPNCSNNAFTQAIALILLMFSDAPYESGGYIRFNDEGMFLVISDGTKAFNTIEKYKSLRVAYE